MINIRKPIIEADIRKSLEQGKITLPPLSLHLLKMELKTGNHRFDALVEASWENSKAKFAVEIRALSTPKAFMEACAVIKTTKLKKDEFPMLIMPYLKEEQLRALEKDNISGIDLCGNGVVIVPGRLSIFRTGQENRFPSYAPIKNIYRKNSSLVGRVFLVEPIFDGESKFDSVKGVLERIDDLNPLKRYWGLPSITMATVSKVLSGLEKDLIISRTRDIRLLQADVLLDKLAESYAVPENRPSVSLKVDLEKEALLEALAKTPRKGPIVMSGLSSVPLYATMQRGEVLSVYYPKIDELIASLPARETDRFANLVLIETDDPTVYFAARGVKKGLWGASPVQTYLELMQGDKRDQEVAQEIRKSFLNIG